MKVSPQGQGRSKSIQIRGLFLKKETEDIVQYQQRSARTDLSMFAPALRLLHTKKEEKQNELY